MSNEIHQFPAESGSSLILNKRTGKWVIAKSLDSKVEELLSEDQSCERFTGTQMVVLNVSRSCNLRCLYCYVDKLKSSQKMSYEIGRTAIDRIFELPESSRVVVFHGHEPMTNFGLIKDLIKYARSKGNIEFCMQSNGTLFRDESIEYLAKENVGIGISLDGFAIHQNKTRQYSNGSYSFDDVLANLSKIKSTQKGINVISVVTSYNVNDLQEIVNYFEKLGIGTVSLNPIYPEESHDLSPDQRTLTKNMIDIFERYLQNNTPKNSRIVIANLRNLLRTFFTPKTNLNCTRCSSTSLHPLIGIDVDGSIYPCDLFWGKEEFRIGNISKMSLEESFNSSKNFRTYRDIRAIESCRECTWLRFCGGDCPGASIRLNRGIASQGHYCEYNKVIFEYAARKIPLLHERRMLGRLLRGV